MVSNGGGGQQDPVVERLIRLELEIKASNERSEARLDRMNEQTNERLAASNQRLTDAINLIVESIRQTNQRIDETNQRIDETNRRIDETNRRIEETNNRIDDANNRTDTLTENLRREFRSDFNKLFYTVLGAGAAVIVTVVTAQLFG